MRSHLLPWFCLLALSGCSKEQPVDTPEAPPAPEASTAPNQAQVDAFALALKKAFAAQLTVSGTEACASVKGSEMPELGKGSTMSYGADGTVAWGASSFNYVTAPGGSVGWLAARGEQTFSATLEVTDLGTDQRQFIASVTQLKGGHVGTTVTDSTASTPDNNVTVGNLCAGASTPPLASQGAWPLAAALMTFPPTEMQCVKLGQLSFKPVKFAFDGTTVQAGALQFTAADAQHAEQLMIDPRQPNNMAVYGVDTAAGTGFKIGLSEKGKLTFAEIEETPGSRLACGVP